MERSQKKILKLKKKKLTCYLLQGNLILHQPSSRNVLH